MTAFKKGDHVAWNTPQGKTNGKVLRKVTHNATIKGHHVAASPQDPQYEVQSDKSGQRAFHKPKSLDKK